LEGVEKCLDDKKKKYWGHIVALVDTGGVVDFGVFFSNFDFYSAVFVELFYILYYGRG